MDAPIQALLTAIQRAQQSQPANLADALRALPEPDVLLSPWNAWTLLGLARHRDRQLWVAGIIRDRLSGSLAELGAMGSLGHPEGVPQSGPVPGLPGWEYYFHGRGCCVSHKVDGDVIDVDFWDDSAEYFDVYFYQRFLESLHSPAPPEERQRRLHTHLRGICIAFGDLRLAGGLIPLSGERSHPMRLADEVVAVADEIDAFCRAWSEGPHRVWLSALIGDWLAADEAATGHPELMVVTAPRAERCRELRAQRLETLLEGADACDALLALADLNPASLDQLLERTLQGPPSGLVSAALEVIAERDSPKWRQPVDALFQRLQPAGAAPEPHLWMTSLKFLVRHGWRRDELLPALVHADGTEIAEAVLLSLEHAPHLALPAIRKALQHRVPLNRMDVAAILALINRPWSRRELFAALQASEDQQQTSYVRAALVELGDDEACQAVLDWEGRNPHEAETPTYLEIGGRQRGPFYSMDEMMLNQCAPWIRHAMDKLRERVEKVQGVIPPEPHRPWWQFWKG